MLLLLSLTPLGHKGGRLRGLPARQSFPRGLPCTCRGLRVWGRSQLYNTMPPLLTPLGHMGILGGECLLCLSGEGQPMWCQGGPRLSRVSGGFITLFRVRAFTPEGFKGGLWECLRGGTLGQGKGKLSRLCTVLSCLSVWGYPVQHKGMRPGCTVQCLH